MGTDALSDLLHIDSARKQQLQSKANIIAK